MSFELKADTETPSPHATRTVPDFWKEIVQDCQLIVEVNILKSIAFNQLFQKIMYKYYSTQIK